MIGEETGREVVAQLMSEQAPGTGAGAVGLVRALLENQAQQVAVRGRDRRRSLYVPPWRSRNKPCRPSPTRSPHRTGPARSPWQSPDGDGPWPGVVMYPDAGGVRPAFHEMAARLAGLGYVVLLPDVYATGAGPGRPST